MNIIEVLTFPIGVITLVLFIAALWQINKGRNKKIAYTMRSGFGAILIYYLLYALQSYILNEDVSNLSVETYRIAMTVLHSVGCALFAWGFFLLAKEYRNQ
jgi:uncharacterized membrane protein YozB (DUF420 family)